MISQSSAGGSDLDGYVNLGQLLKHGVGDGDESGWLFLGGADERCRRDREQGHRTVRLP